MPTCFICRKDLPSIKALSCHFKLVHDSIQTDRFVCCENNCNRKFSLLNSFKKHLKSHIQATSELNSTLNTNTSSANNISASGSSFSGSASSHSSTNEILSLPSLPQQNEPCTSSSIEDTTLRGFQQRFAQFCANLYSKPQIPRNYIQSVVEGLSSVVVEGLKETAASLSNQTNSENLPVMTSLFNIVESNLDAFNSEHKRLKYFENLGTYIPPCEYGVGESLIEIRKNNVSHLVPNVCTQQLIDIKRVLKKFLEIENLFEDMLMHMKKVSENHTLYMNFIQGTVWTEKSQNHDEGKVFPLFLYFDDFEIGNPLGSHSGLHKLGALYISIPCLPDHYKSLLRTIVLFLLFHSSDRTTFGNEVLFKPIIDELNFLRDIGIEIQTKTFKGVVKFELGILVGDNLGLHSITGLVESFSANYCCRYCKVDKNSLKTMCVLNKSLIRTEDSYLKDSEECSVADSGIKEPCVWQKVKGFNVVQQLGVDAMHDLLEGVCKYDILFLLSYYVNQVNFFSLETLNERLRCFDFGPDTGSKPVAITIDNLKKQNIRQSASEMLVLVRYFGLLVGDLIPENDKVWDLYLVLREIVDIVMSPSIQKETCVLLETLITEHHQLYLQFSGKQLTPKFHFLLHYPGLIVKFGPLVALWSMRFEAKHRTSKIAANSSASRRNICKSIAIKHQLLLNDLFMTNDLGNNLTFSQSVKTIDTHVNYEQFLPFSIKTLLLVSWVKIKGTKYYINSVLTTSIEENAGPSFGYVKEIYIVNCSKVMFKCVPLKVLCYNEHLCCYQVEYSRDESVHILFDNLPSHVPNNINTSVSGQTFVTVRGGL